MLQELHFAYKNNRHAFFLYKCKCGKEKIIRKSHVVSGDTISCGCYRNKKLAKQSFRHGGGGTKIYQRWVNIRMRCRDKSRKIYEGRGIKVCKEWGSFVVFRDWALENGYKDELTLDRLNNNLGYSPDNCRWISMGEQQRNKRNNIKYKGETASVASRRLGGGENLVSKRIAYGWSPERAFNTLPR